MFAGLAIAQTVLARRSPSRPVRRGAVPFVAIAVVLIAIGWTYPHFLAHESDWMYLYSAPVGVLALAVLAWRGASDRPRDPAR